MQQCKWTLDPILETSWFFVMDQIINDAYQVDLQPIRKDRSLCKNWLWMDFYWFPTSVVLYFCFTQPKDIPLRLLTLIQVPTLLYGLKRSSNKVPLQHAYLSLDMPLSLQPGFPSIHHQPSTSTPYKTYYLQKHIAYHNVVIGVGKSNVITTNLNTFHVSFSKKKIKKEKKPISIIFKFSFLSYLPLSYSTYFHLML
jgi:hypothetical protein